MESIRQPKAMDTRWTERIMKSEFVMLDVKKVMGITGLSRTTLWRRVKDGEFPVPRQLGPRRFAWCSTELYEFLEGLPPVSYSKIARMNGDSAPS